MARRNKKKQEEQSGDGWLATYADTITLLLTFFILLYSMSSIDAGKMEQLSEAFQTMMTGKEGDTILEYNLYDGDVPIIGGDSDTEESLEESEDEIEEMYNKLKEFIEENGLSDVIDITDTDRGVLIQLSDNVLFQSAKATLIEESKGVLNEISGLISKLPNRILVEGHTDTVPINTAQFPTNWELSVDRAVNVVRYFVEEKGLNPSRFTAAGYGEYQPIAPNDTATNMALNRRVNILILSEEDSKENKE